jgi:nitrilase
VEGDERLVVADLDLDRVAQEQQKFDRTGRYSRPDVFTVQADRRRREAAESVD